MEAKIIIREAMRADTGDVLAVQRLAPEAAAWTEADYLDLTPAGAALFLLAEDTLHRQAVGFLMARVVADEMEVLNLAVSPAHRRLGIARLLLAEALARGQAQGARQCWLELRASNQAALKFYRAMGFVETQRRRQYYREPEEDAVVCIRGLAAAGVAP